MTDTDYKKMLAQLERHEGKRLTAYLCTAGALTVGIGHNCMAWPVKGVSKVGDRITPEQCQELFLSDVARFEGLLASNLPWTERLKECQPARYAVLVNMAFNLGIRGLLGFKTTLEHVRCGNYPQAAAAMLQSKWAGQVKGRAKELSKQMECGQWV